MTRGFGRLGWQLTVAFVGVGLAAVVAALAITSLNVTGYESQIRAQRQRQETAAVAGAAAAYARSGQAAMIASVLAASDHLGAAAQVRDATGHVLRTSPGFARTAPIGRYRVPVVVGRRKVAVVVLRFGDRGLTGLFAKFNAERWQARIVGGGAGVLLALMVALLLAPRITGPLDRLLRVTRARAAGRSAARAGDVGGFRDIRQLAATFDQMADVADRQEQFRRNLVADVAHELRTPVAVMRAETEAMLDGVTNTDADTIRSLHEEVLRLGRMIEDLQQLAAAEAAALQLVLAPCDLANTARTAARGLRGTFREAGVNLDLRLEPTLARCDQHRMQDVLRNLLINASKYTPPGGTVVVETLPAGNHAVLRVSDTGIGIPADELPRVTERFYRGRTSEGAGGSGIGLAVVDELVRAQHGALQIVSEPGQGTRVAIMLPCPDRGERDPSSADHMTEDGQALPPSSLVP